VLLLLLYEQQQQQQQHQQQLVDSSRALIGVLLREMAAAHVALRPCDGAMTPAHDDAAVSSQRQRNRASSSSSSSCGRRATCAADGALAPPPPRGSVTSLHAVNGDVTDAMTSEDNRAPLVAALVAFIKVYCRSVVSVSVTV